MPQSKYPGYANGALYRVHNGNYSESADMEDPKLPLYAKQKDVPLLPVPELDATVELLIKSLKPIASTPEEFEAVSAKAKALLAPNSLARELQKRLQERAKEYGAKRTSWFIDWWNQWAYLTYRDSVVHNVSYELLFKDECVPAMKNVARRAARFTKHALDYRQMVIEGTLTPDMDNGTKLPMSNTQHKYVFNACRMPAPQSDVVRTYAPDLHQYVVVARKGRFYSVGVLDEKHQLLGVDALEKRFADVIAAADAEKSSPVVPIGILTADDRDVWLASRTALVAASSTNEASLEVIQGAAFVICFDEAAPVTRADVARHMLHGEGRNRFFDKSFQLIVTANGKMAYMGEHSLTDGLTTTRFVNYCLDKMMKEPESRQAVKRTASALAPQAPARLLPFVDAPAVSKAIAAAAQTFEALQTSKELEVLMFYGFGSDMIKKQFKVSPDAFAQVAMQLANRRVFGHPRSTYESTQTRTFLHGRTEVTRSVSSDSEAFCDAVEAGAALPELRAKLVKACSSHSEYTKKASKAMGVDRHLLALSMLVKQGEKLPELYSDPVFIKGKTWFTSTSGLAGENMDGWAFGEVTPDGVGIGYSVQAHRLRFTVSSAHPKEKYAGRMVAEIENALVLMRDACLSSAADDAAPRAKL